MTNPISTPEEFAEEITCTPLWAIKQHKVTNWAEELIRQRDEAIKNAAFCEGWDKGEAQGKDFREYFEDVRAKTEEITRKQEARRVVREIRDMLEEASCSDAAYSCTAPEDYVTQWATASGIDLSPELGEKDDAQS